MRDEPSLKLRSITSRFSLRSIPAAMNPVSSSAPSPVFGDFLQHIGATLHADGHIGFDRSVKPENSNDTKLMVLGQYALLAFSGADSSKFLQGQTTCNVKDISPTKSLPGACCSPKGRMYCNFQMALDNDQHYWLRMRRDILDSSLQTLNKYLALFRGSQAQACSESHLVLGLTGKGATELLGEWFGACPQHSNDSIASDDMIAICIEPEQRYELWLGTAAALQRWPQLSARCHLADSRDWQLANIQAGRADIYPQTRDEFVPQMLNLQALNAISFNKGCYTGQEIVARMHYLGKLKKRLYRARVDIDEPPAVGSELFALNAISGEQQAVGHVAEAALAGEHYCELLVVIPDELVESGRAISLGENGPEIAVLPLPYAITTAQTSKP